MGYVALAREGAMRLCRINVLPTFEHMLVHGERISEKVDLLTIVDAFYAETAVSVTNAFIMAISCECGEDKVAKRVLVLGLISSSICWMIVFQENAGYCAGCTFAFLPSPVQKMTHLCS